MMGRGRHEPREVRPDVLEREVRDMTGDTLSDWDGVVRVPQCRFSLRGMPCDCLRRVAARAGRRP